MEKFFHAFSLNVHTLIAEHQALKLLDMINFYSKFLEEKKHTHTHDVSFSLLAKQTGEQMYKTTKLCLRQNVSIQCKKLRLVKSELAFQFARLICVHIFRQFHQ